MNKNNNLSIILIFISLFLLFGIFLLLSTQNNINYSQVHKQSQPQKNIIIPPIPTFHQDNIKQEQEQELLFKPGYENELIYISDEIKSGTYVNQFQEVDLEKIKYSNNQISYNPIPRCSSGALPLANININYLNSHSDSI